MAEFNVNDTTSLLTRTPAALDALLRGLPDLWTHRNEGGTSWTPFDVIGHLIHVDQTDWMVRIRWTLEHGDSEPFPPFDRQGHKCAIEGKSLAQLLDEFARVRTEKLGELNKLNLSPEDFERRGRHPALGTVTISELLAAWAGHDLTHLHQISRIMAHQYREAVGPFREYLGVMQCTGHGG